jgi:WD40 repeat protein/serine/threonine protein kinase
VSEDPLTHPSAEELRALSVGQLGEVDLARVSAHLRDCPECCRYIDELTVVDPLLARLQQSAAGRGETLVGPAQRRSAVRALRRGHAARAAAGTSDPVAEPVILPVPNQVGDYEILAEVGRGGMGVVYKARHRGLHRLAALKMVLAGEFASPAQELRFRLEAELAARVQHPNIVQVYEIGNYQGRPFLALEWIEGGSLANRLDGNPWPPRDAASLLETLARAIHVAHSEGVVHRDLKPANILLQETDPGTRPRGQSNAAPSIPPSSSFCPHPSSLIPHPSFPKITDFGLAQRTEGGAILTQSGLLVGTPGYMAPEQAGGSDRRALVGPATDIYALGVILYQLLTGQLPFQGETTLEVLRAVVSDEPMRPRRLQPRLPRDLEAITLHCLEKEPNRRYPSALALAEDLERFREGRQVAARPVGWGARLARACQRRPLVALLLGLLCASFFGGLSGVTWKWLEANEQRDLANSQALRADAERDAALFQAYRARLAAAVAALSAHDVADAERQLDAAPAELQDWEWRHLRSRLDDSSAAIRLPGGGVGTLFGAPDRLRVGALTPDGLHVMDLEGGEHRTLLSGRNVRFSVSVAQTCRGLRIGVWASKTTVELLDESGQVVARVKMPDVNGPLPLLINPDGTRLVSLRYDGPWMWFVVFDTTSGKQIAVCDRFRDDMWTHAFSPDGTRLVLAGEDQTTRLWDLATGRLLATCRGHASKVVSAAFRPDGARLVTTSSDGTVRQWDAATGREVEPPYDRHSGDVAAAVYSPDGQWIASAGTDRTVRVWRARGRRDVAVLHGHTGPVVGVAFAPDGRRLASMSYLHRIAPMEDGTVRIWDVDPRATLPVLRGHTSYVYPVAFSPDGRWIASGGWDGKIWIWDARTGEACARLDNGDLVRTLAFSPNGSRLVSKGHDRLKFWEVATGRRLEEIPVALDNLAVAFHPDGQTLAALDVSGGATVFNSATGAVVARLRLGVGHDSKALAYSPDGRWLAGTSPDQKTVCLFDAQTYEPSAQFRGHDGIIRAVAFAPDGSRIASCGQDRTVRVWPIDGGACQVLPGHTDEVFAVAFHPDGRRLASAGRDRAVWLWDLARGEEVARLQGHTSYVWSLAFSPDGATLASGSGDFTVRLWDTAPLKVRHEARREAEALRPEAERLVESLWRQKHDPVAVVEALRADRALSEPLRHAAQLVVLRRAQPPADAAGNPLEQP